ncbi:MAG: hypothetical protein MSS76_01390 [Clostridium sp.]|nr:hypothetical protein [Clostridium sp.]
MIDFKELIELFILRTLPSIKSEKEIPNINFIFDNNSIELFNYVMEHPFRKKDVWTEDITSKDLEITKEINNMNPNSNTIIIDDGISFFDYLTSIVNEHLKLFKEYEYTLMIRSTTMSLLTRIWLRMDDNDFNDVISFLKKELDFYKDRTLDKYRTEIYISSYEGIDSYAECNINESWDETTRSMNFRLENSGESHTISRVLYDIRSENGIKVCYIYGVQNNLFNITNKRIERKLYKLNKGIDNPKVHPNQLYSLILFLEILKKEGITTIKVPKNQTLSYGYHKILSNNEKSNFKAKWPTKKVRKIYSSDDEDSINKRHEYELDKEWFKHIVGKENTIERLKTDKLFELLRRLCLYDPSFEFVGISPNNDEILVYKLRK